MTTTGVVGNRETPYRIAPVHKFFGEIDDGAEDVVVAFDHPPHYLYDEEIIELAAQVRRYQQEVTS